MTSLGLGPRPRRGLHQPSKGERIHHLSMRVPVELDAMRVARPARGRLFAVGLERANPEDLSHVHMARREARRPGQGFTTRTEVSRLEARGHQTGDAESSANPTAGLGDKFLVQREPAWGVSISATRWNRSVTA